jgi:MFS family permease
MARGGSSVLSPMYIADISPKQWRGRLVACFQFAVVAGILVAYASNTLVCGFHLRVAIRIRRLLCRPRSFSSPCFLFRKVRGG